MRSTIDIIPLCAARLCLNCESITDAPQCPLCGSQALHHISRWINRGTSQETHHG